MIVQTSPSVQGTDLSGLPAPILAQIQTSPREFLERVPLFRGLPADQLDLLARMAEVQNFRRHAPIIRQGEPNRHIYFIKDGIVGVTVAAQDEGDEERVVSYFHQNHIFGEFGLFASEEHIATATVTALSEVNLLRIAHSDFTSLLNDYHPAAMEVARILTERLKAPTDRLVPLPQERNVFLVMGLNKGVGMTTVGSTLAAALAKQLEEDGEVVYTEYPDGYKLPATFGYAETEFYQHPEGFDVFVPRGMPRLAAVVNLELIIERLQKRYKNVIISLPSKLLYDVADILKLVSKVVLVASPARWDSLQEIEEVLHVSPYLKEDSILSVANYCLPDYAQYPKPEDADFTIPFLVGMNLADKQDGIPEQLELIAQTMAGRLSSQNEVVVYMPATVLLPNGEQINTNPAIEKLMWVLKDAFGNAHLSKLGDEAHLLSSLASVNDLNEKWRHVLQQVQNIKSAVRQEVLAVEINRNLVLV